MNKFCTVLPVVFQFSIAAVTSGANIFPPTCAPTLKKSLALSILLTVFKAALAALRYRGISKRFVSAFPVLKRFLPVPAINAPTPAGAPAPVIEIADEPAAKANSSKAIDVIIPAV